MHLWASAQDGAARGAGVDRVADRRCRRYPVGTGGEGASHGSPPRLLERDVHVQALWAHVSGGWAGPVAIEGRAGSGRTALLRSVCRAAEASGWTVLRAGAGHRPAATSLADAVPSGAAIGRILVAVDDADRPDDALAAWLDHLVRCPDPRLSLAVTVGRRPPGTPVRPVDHVLGDPATLVVPVGPLSPASVEVLAGQYFGTPVTSGFARASHHESGGYPALLFALFHEVALGGTAPDDTAVGRVGTLTSSALARAVARRVGLLDAATAAVLRAVAVVDGPVEPGAVAEVAGIEPRSLGMSADRLAGLDLLEPTEPLTVLPPLLRRTVRAEIPAGVRFELHRRWARVLKGRGAPPHRVADHLLAAEPGGEPWVADDLQRLGEQALRTGKAARAATYVRRALAEGTGTADRASLLATLARAEAGTDLPAAAEHLRQASRPGTAPEAVVHAALEIAGHGHDPEARDHLWSVLRQVAGAVPADEGTAVDVLAAATLLAPADALPATADRLRRAVDALADRGSPVRRGAAALVATLDVVGPRPTGSGDPGAVLRWAMLGDPMVDGDPLRAELWARAVLALARTGAFREADRHAGEAGAAAAAGQRIAEAEFSATLAASLALQGLPVDAERQARHALAAAAGRPWARRPEAVACLVGTLVDQGRLDEADTVAAALDGNADGAPAFGSHRPLEERGRLRAAQGRHAEALRDLLLAGRCSAASGVGSPAATSWRREAALVLAAAGRPAEAADRASEDLELAESQGVPWVVGTALHLAAVLGPPAQRLPRLERAVHLLEGAEVQLPLARALVDLGRALHQAAAPTGHVRGVLRRGADLAVRCGSAPVAARAAAELRRAGARPRRLAQSGVAALTSAERRVVALAASGLTNAEIADRLVLTRKTIEGHLFRSYRKLQVRSRRELQALALGGAAGGSQAT